MTVFAFLGGLVLFLMLLGCAVLKFGGLVSLTAYLNGESVCIHPKTLDLGPNEAGTETIAMFRMQNLTSREISVVGEKSSCRCAFSEHIPITAAPGKTVDVKITVRLPKYDKEYDQTITLMVAEPDRLAMHPVRIIATIPQPLPRPAEGTETAANP